MYYDGYVLGFDKECMYSIIVDSKKSYQMNCEIDLLKIDRSDIIPERKFKIKLLDDDIEIIFLDEYINEDITIEKLKKMKNV